MTQPSENADAADPDVAAAAEAERAAGADGLVDPDERADAQVPWGPGESNIGRTDLIQRDADYDDSDATGMSAGPTFRRGARVDPAEPTNAPDEPDLTDPADDPDRPGT